jgi:predicted dinucleotide-binding enzyme
MKIAIIGTGNVGAALATRWAIKGHEIYLGVRDVNHFKGMHLLQNPNTEVLPIESAVRLSGVILVATPALSTVEVVNSLGDTSGKIIIDAMNIVMGKGPAGYKNTSDAILANTHSKEIIKCFNITGYNNMLDPMYGDQALDMFMAGDSGSGKQLVRQLALDAGFAECYDVGGNNKFELMEQFAWFWINLAMVQGQGREIGFKLLKR